MPHQGRILGRTNQYPDRPQAALAQKGNQSSHMEGGEGEDKKGEVVSCTVWK